MHDIPTLFIIGGSGQEHYRLFREVNLQELLANANLSNVDNASDVTWVLQASEDPSWKIYKNGNVEPIKQSKVQSGDVILLPVEALPFPLYIVFPSGYLEIEKIKSIFHYPDPLFLISEFYPYGKATTFQIIQAIQKQGVLPHQLMVQLVREERRFSASDLVGIEGALEAAIKLFTDKGVNISSIDINTSIPFYNFGTILFQRRKRTLFIWDKVKEEVIQFISDLNVLYEEDLQLELSAVPWSTQIEMIFSYPGPSISTYNFRKRLKSKTTHFIEKFIAEPLTELLIDDYGYEAVYSDHDYVHIIEKTFNKMMERMNSEVDGLQQNIRFEKIKDIKKYRKEKKRQQVKVDITEKVHYQITIQPIRQKFTTELRNIITDEMDQLRKDMLRDAEELLKKMEETYEQ